MKLHNLNYLPTILTSFLLLACTGVREEMDVAVPGEEEKPCEVHFWMEEEGSRTAVASDLQSVSWEDGDHLALWAFKPDGMKALSAQDFVVYGRSDKRAFFSTTLAKPMAEGSYIYWAASPYPTKVQDNDLYFSIPSEQNGKGSGVMLSNLVQSGPLKNKKEQEELESECLALEMNQQLHLLRFYLQDDQNLLGGEQIEKIEFDFPSEVTGTLRTSLPASTVPGVPSPEQTLQNGDKKLNLVLEQKLGASSGTNRQYAFATIFPRQWGPDDSFSARLYGQSKIAIVDGIMLGGKNMQAAHATSVKLAPNRLREYRRIFINFRSNPIGEPIQSITLTAPSGCKWGDKLGNSYTISTGKDILPGDSFIIEFEDNTAFTSLSGKTITASFESEHLICTQSIKMANLSSVSSTTINLDVAPLLQEDFSSVPGFSSNDAYSSGFNTGSKDPHTFLNGWSGARCGAKAGVAVRLACRRETSADYDARMESAPIACTIKKPVDLKVTFDYGTGGEGTTIKIFGYTIPFTPVGQTVHVGYITTTSNYASGSTSGVYNYNFSINADSHAVEGSYDMCSLPASCVLHSVPAGTSVIRISWRTVIEHMAGANNNTDWLYVDNVFVSVNK